MSEPRYRRSPSALWRRSLDAVILLPTDADDPVTLPGTGPDVWDGLDEPTTAADLASRLASAYDADPAQVGADLEPLLDQLLELGAIEVVA